MNPNQNQVNPNNSNSPIVNANQVPVGNQPQGQNVAQVPQQSPAQIPGGNVNQVPGQSTLGNTTSQVNISGGANPTVPTTTNLTNNGNQQPINTAISTNEPMKEVNINYKPPSKFKTFLLIVFFIFLIGFVIFLPEINSFIEEYKASKNSSLNEKIVNGDLVCTLSRNTSQLDISYEVIFGFTDNKLVDLDYSKVIRGDISLDEETLITENTNCENLKNVTTLLDGVSVSCEFANETVTQREKFVYNNINLEEVTSAYSEAGGTYPEFENGEDMDYIEKNMKASGYTCERRR